MNKELKNAYKQYKPDMGVYAFTCKPTGTVYLGYGQDVKGDINSLTFRLKLGSFSSDTKCGLQADWKTYGESNFEIVVLEQLERSTDETKTNYQEDLRTLRTLCAERFPTFAFIHT